MIIHLYYYYNWVSLLTLMFRCRRYRRPRPLAQSVGVVGDRNGSGVRRNGSIEFRFVQASRGIKLLLIQ